MRHQGGVLAIAALLALAGPAQAAQAPQLQGIVLLGDARAFKPDGVPARGAPFVDALAVPAIAPDAAQHVLADDLGKPIDVALMKQIRDQLQAYFQSIHQPFVAVNVRPQVIDSGVVQVIVTVARLGKVSVAGNDWFAQDQYIDALRAQPGQPIDGAQLDSDIDRINRNQYRHATAVASPGAAVGTTDLLIKTQEDRPFTFTDGVDNTGTQTTSLYRWNTGFDWGNAFWRGDDLNYRFTGSTEVDLLQEHALSYTTELPWGHTLTVSGTYALSSSPLESIIGNSGVTGTAALRYAIPLDGPSWLTHRITLGYDFKSTNNNILFGGAEVFGTTSEIDQFSVDYGGDATDSLGTTSYALTLVFSPGGLTGGNTDAIFKTQIPDAKAQYFYVHAFADRVTNLPDSWSWDLRATLQLADQSLLPSENIALTGYAAVRGYEEQAGVRDNGFLIQNEIRAPPIPLKLPTFLGASTLGDQLVPFVFLDYGAGWNHHNGSVNGSWLSVASIGPGITYQAGKAVYVRFTWGFSLGHSGQDMPRLGPQFAVQLSI